MPLTGRVSQRHVDYVAASIHLGYPPSTLFLIIPFNYSTKMACSVVFLSVTNLLTPPRHSYKVVAKGQSHKWPSMCTQWAIWLNVRHSKANVKYSFKGQMMLWKDCVLFCAGYSAAKSLWCLYLEIQTAQCSANVIFVMSILVSLLGPNLLLPGLKVL